MREFLFAILMIVTLTAYSQEKILLYPDGPAESNELIVAESFRDAEFIMNISEPRMLAFPADKAKANGTAVLICPGGGYGGVSQIKEGSEIAEWFNESEFLLLCYIIVCRAVFHNIR
jgi:hypothetical protein